MSTSVIFFFFPPLKVNHEHEYCNVKRVHPLSGVECLLLSCGLFFYYDGFGFFWFFVCLLAVMNYYTSVCMWTEARISFWVNRTACSNFK